MEEKQNNSNVAVIIPYSSTTKTTKFSLSEIHRDVSCLHAGNSERLILIDIFRELYNTASKSGLISCNR